MDLLLKDQIALVGGASKGIGYGIAHQLAEEGATVILVARRQADLKAAAAQIAKDTGAATHVISADCRKAEDCERVIAETQQHFGGLDVLVNNDGAPPLGEIAVFDDDAWHRAIEQNFMYVARMVRGALPHMRNRGGGSILNISALSAIQPEKGFGLSVASWGAVIGYAKTLSLEVAAQGINVNTLCPGYIDTSRLQKVFGAGGENGNDMRDDLISKIPIGRLGTVEDIASFVALLVSPRGRFITGTTIAVDGGLFKAVR